MQKSGKIAVIASVLMVTLLVMVLVFAKPVPRGTFQCDDGIDNDGDGYTDYPSDPGCSRRTDKTETNPDIECDDGIDNDGDSNIDMDDTGCSSPTDDDETDCGDGVCEGGETSGSCPADCGIPDNCSDTDGGNFITVFGTTSGYLNETPYSNDDYCVDTSNIMEYYCSGNYEQTSQQSCGTDYYGQNYCANISEVWRDSYDYFCASGECDLDVVPEFVEWCQYGCTNGTCDPIPDSCSDTDGGWVIDVQGSVSGYNNENPYNYTDSCNGTYLEEWYCSGDSPDVSAIDCLTNFTGCSNGACVL